MINKIKETIPPQLKKYNLMVNETKTEQYQIPRPHPDPLPLDLNSALDQNDIRWSALDWITNAKQPTPSEQGARLEEMQTSRILARCIC